MPCIPQVDSFSGLFDNPSVIIPPLSLEKSPRFSLDTAGVLGLIGGQDAMSAMAAVHVYRSKRWLGWYNTPGSFQMYKRLNAFASSAAPRTVPAFLSESQEVHADPIGLFKTNARKGPKFRAAHSGTVMQETSHLAALFMSACIQTSERGVVVPGRKTQPVTITIADLEETPGAEMRPAHSSASTLFYAFIPIAFSLWSCGICAFYEDWCASWLILVGIVASGVSGLVLGSAELTFSHPTPAKGSPAGDGLLTSDANIVLLKGTEGAVNAITRGRFSLCFASARQLGCVWWCSFLFLFQCLAQLLLVSQATLFGQVVFLGTLGVSAAYNRWVCVSSGSGEQDVQQKILFERVLKNPRLTRYTLGTRTTAVVFMLLVLRPENPVGLLDELLPNDTQVWKRWKTTVVEWLRRLDDNKSLRFAGDLKVGDLCEFTEQENKLLETLYGDARAAYEGYKDCFTCRVEV